MWVEVFIALTAVLIAAPLTFHTHVFSEKVLAEIARESIAKGEGNSTLILESVVVKLREKYGPWIIKDPEWVFNNAGGAMGAMTVLHASMSEYILIFGSAIGTEGHTGRFLADDWFTILVGEQWAYEAGALKKEIYKPGDVHHLKFGKSKGYRMPDECWALEYARGNIVSMFPFGVFEVFFSTLDFQSLVDTVRISATAMGANLAKGKV